MPKINQEEYEVLKEHYDMGGEWIARDADGLLYYHKERPNKLEHSSDNVWDSNSFPMDTIGDGKKLFHFVRWTDSEPYNIAELIEEYEFENVLSDKEQFEEWYHGTESEETEVKKDKEWLKDSITRVMQDFFNTPEPNYFDFEKANKRMRELTNQLDEPEVLSQEWVDENEVFIFDLDDDCEIRYVPSLKLRHLLVPTLSEMETVEITEEQVVEWLNNNDFYDHRTAETVLANAVDKGELGYYGTKYSVVKKEPETVEEVVADFARSLERLRELWRNIGVEELEE